MNKVLLTKVAEFTKIALSELDDLQSTVEGYRIKAAAEDEKLAKYDHALKKAASALYNSDFLTDEDERNKFLKLAKDDPSYLARVIEKVCNAADVALIGSPARVAQRNKQASVEFDPVWARAFGGNSNTGALLEDE